jgi:hypothetical protein
MFFLRLVALTTAIIEHIEGCLALTVESRDALQRKRGGNMQDTIDASILDDVSDVLAAELKRQRGLLASYLSTCSSGYQPSALSSTAASNRLPLATRKEINGGRDDSSARGAPAESAWKKPDSLPPPTLPRF